MCRGDKTCEEVNNFSRIHALHWSRKLSAHILLFLDISQNYNVLKEHVWIGIGAIVSNNLKIYDHVTIGAGAVVVKDIEEAGIYIGIPAKKRG